MEEEVPKKKVVGRPFEKGKAIGRPLGVKNKLTKTVKETVLKVFNELQKDPKKNLLEFGKKHPIQFYQMAAKLIPTEITGTSTQVIRVLSLDFDEQDKLQGIGIDKALEEYVGDEVDYEEIDEDKE
jgi:hypothetical protein